MNKCKKHIYPEELEFEICKSGYIPRLMKNGERLKVFHKYWTSYFGGTIKIIDIDNIFNHYYYYIRYNGKLLGCFPHPLPMIINNYELLHNYNHIEKDNIINSNKSYSGAEIKFWFVKNHIDLDSPKYKGFWSFLNPNSTNVLHDSKYYFVVRNNSKKQPFQMISDKNRP